MNLIHANGNKNSISLQDFFTRKKKLTEQAANSGNAGTSLVSQPRFDAPLDSVDVKSKKSLASEKSSPSQIGSLLEGLNQAYSEDKDPKAEKELKKSLDGTPKSKKTSKFDKKPVSDEISKPKFPGKKPSLELVKK